MKNQILTLISAFLLSNAVFATDNFSIPNTFNSGETISSQKMNENFEEIQDLLNKLIQLNNLRTEESKLFVAVGNSGTILTSSDGTTWTSRTSGTTNNLYGVTYGNSTFVTVGQSGTILTSTDGTTWTSRTSGTSNSLSGVTYGNGSFVTVGYSISSSSTSTSDNSTPTITTVKSTTTLTSSDGVTWTLRDSGTSNELRGSITYGNGLFVTVGWEGTILTSSDGISWDNRTSGTSNTLSGVTYIEYSP